MSCRLCVKLDKIQSEHKTIPKRAQMVDPASQNPDLPSGVATPVHHTSVGRPHTVIIRRYRFVGGCWVWCYPRADRFITPRLPARSPAPPSPAASRP
jgi:hypothetical protein